MREALDSQTIIAYILLMARRHQHAPSSQSRLFLLWIGSWSMLFCELDAEIGLPNLSL